MPKGKECTCHAPFLPTLLQVRKSLAQTHHTRLIDLMADDPDLDSAYDLKSTEDTARLYQNWAATYDNDFAGSHDYILHDHVARAFAELGGRGPVLDVGAGTGLCGAALKTLGCGPIDATDLSPEMLDVASKKDIYRHLFAGDLLEGLALPDGPYEGLVSSGTFTHGHIGPDGIDALFALARPKALAVLSINTEHFDSKGFAVKFAALGPRITDLQKTEVRIYGRAATGTHTDDTAFIVRFRLT